MSQRRPVTSIDDVACEIAYMEDDLVLARVKATGQASTAGYQLPKLEMIGSGDQNGYMALRMTVEPLRRETAGSSSTMVQVETMQRINPARCKGVTVYGANNAKTAGMPEVTQRADPAAIRLTLGETLFFYDGPLVAEAWKPDGQWLLGFAQPGDNWPMLFVPFDQSVYERICGNELEIRDAIEQHRSGDCLWANFVTDVAEVNEGASKGYDCIARIMSRAPHENELPGRSLWGSNLGLDERLAPAVHRGH